MSGPDGPEERTAYYEERFSGEDMQDEINASYERDAKLNQIPTVCIVQGHDWVTNQFGLTFCHKCGNDQWDEPK